MTALLLSRCRDGTRLPLWSAELGIDIPAILSRTKSILTFRLSGHDVDSLDLGGPLILMAILGCAHLLVSGRCCANQCGGASCTSVFSCNVERFKK